MMALSADVIHLGLGWQGRTTAQDGGWEHGGRTAATVSLKFKETALKYSAVIAQGLSSTKMQDLFFSHEPFNPAAAPVKFLSVEMPTEAMQQLQLRVCVNIPAKSYGRLAPSACYSSPESVAVNVPPEFENGAVYRLLITSTDQLCFQACLIKEETADQRDLSNRLEAVLIPLLRQQLYESLMSFRSEVRTVYRVSFHGLNWIVKSPEELGVGNNAKQAIREQVKGLESSAVRAILEQWDQMTEGDTSLEFCKTLMGSEGFSQMLQCELNAVIEGRISKELEDKIASKGSDFQQYAMKI